MNLIKKIGLVSIIALSLGACSQIDTGNIGVESTFGQIKEQTLPPGLYSTIFKTIYEVTVKEVPISLDDLKPKTRDNITLSDVDVIIYFRTNPNDVAKLMTKYAGDLTVLNTGDYVVGFNLMSRIGREAVYRAVSKFDSYDIHTKREELAEIVRKSLQEEVDADAGKGAFVVTNVIVRQLITDPRLEEAIKAAAQVEFDIRRKKQEIELARSEAERKKVEAEGESVANKILSESLSSNLIELRRIESMSKFATQGTHTVIVPQGQNVTPLIGK